MLKNEQTPIQAQWAAFFVGQGLGILPINGILPDGRCTCGKLDCPQAGKHPIYKDWQKGSYFQSVESVRQFWQRHPYANYAILTSGLFVLDIDERNGGSESFERFIKPHIEGVKTLTARSGSGGESKHLYFRDNLQEFKNGSDIYPGIDSRATGGFIIGIGSNHKSGNCYELIDTGGTDTSIRIAELPECLRSLLISAKTKNKSLNKTENLTNNFFCGETQEGARNSTLTSYAGRLRQQGLSSEEMRPRLFEKNKTFSPPLGEQEVLSVLNSVSRYPAGNQLDWNEPNLDYEINEASFQDISVDLIPIPFLNYALKKKKSIGVPVSAIMVSLFTFISAILGAAYKIKPNKNSEHDETLNLWGLIIAPPSSRKTSVLNILKSTLIDIDDFFIKQRGEYKTQIQAELSKLKVDLKENKKDANKKAEIEFKILELKNREIPHWCFFTSDSTPESLGLLFKYNYRGIFLFKDELEGLLGSLSKQGYEQLKSLLNESWNGAKPFRTTRVLRGIVDIKSVTLSILGGIQPDVLGANFREELQRGMGSDGLLARFQLCSIYNTSDLNEPDSTIDTSVVTRELNGLLLALHEKTKEYNLNGSFPNAPLYLSSDSAEIFSVYQRKIHQKILGGDGLNQAYVSHVGKFGRLVLGLSGQFHIVNSIVNNLSIDRPVEKESVELAVKWANYMDKQARSMYFSIGKSSSAKVFVSKIKNGDITDGMSVRAIYRKGWSDLQRPDDVLSAIEAISDSNWVMLIADSPRGGGRKTDIIRFNPKLIEWLKSKNKKIHLDPTDKTDERGDS